MDWTPSSEKVEFQLAKSRELRTSEKSHWMETRSHLERSGIELDDAALAEWQDEGSGVRYAIVVSRDERIFEFHVVFGHEPGASPHLGRVKGWTEVGHEEIRVTDFGFPDIRGRAARVAKLIFEREVAT